MKQSLVLSLCIATIFAGHTLAPAQSGGERNNHNQQLPQLRGRVLDEQGKPLALATVALLNKEGAMIDGAVAGKDGTFTLTKQLAQAHSLRIQIQGYETQIIALKAGQSLLGDIRLKAGSTQLQEVEVKGANRSAFKMQGTSLNASIASTSLGNMPSVVHILATLPFVSATQQSIEVQGRGTPIIYYGHQQISQEELLRINPKDIKDIEVILVPDASYPAGTAAVIKIKPKSVLARRLGLYSQLYVNKHKSWGYTALVQGYYDSPKLSLKLGGRVASNADYTEQDLKMSLTDEAKPTNSHVVNKQNVRNTPAVVWTDAVWRLNDKHELGAKLLLVRLLGLDVDVDIQSKLSLSSGIQKRYTSKLIKEQVKPMNYYSFNTYYHGTLAPKWTLHAELNYYQRRQHFHQLMDIRYSQPANASDREESYSALDGGNWSWRTFVEHSIKGGKLQLGHDGTSTRAEQSYRQVEQSKQQLLPNNDSEQGQTNLGIFASWQQAWSQSLSTQIGLRMEEQANYNKLFSKTQREERHLYFFPSLTLSYTRGAFSGSLTYENISSNPSYERLSNDVLYIDELVLQAGNPMLKPSITNKLSIQAGYKGLTLVASSSHINNAHHISVLSRYDKDPQRVLMRPENFDLWSYRLGLAYAPQIGVWRPTWSIDMYGQDFQYAGRSFNQPRFDLWFKNFLMLPAGFMLQANLQLMTTGEYDAFERRGFWGMDINLMKRFGKAWTLSLNATDLFATKHLDLRSVHAIGEGETLSRYRYPYLSLSATYNFQARQDRYRGGSAGQAERSRF